MDMIEKIKWLEEEIMEEIQGAKAYMNWSKAWEQKDYDISKTFYSMAQQEMQHADKLNQIVTKLMSNHMTEGDYSRLPELMKMINADQIKEAKTYVPEADPEVKPAVKTT